MKYFFNTLSILLIAFLVSCSGEPQPAENPTQELSSKGITDVTQEVDEATATTQKVHVYGIDKMKYVVKAKNNALKTSGTVNVNGTTYYLLEGFYTKAGENLTVTLTTISDLPAASMSHNWLLLKQKADPSVFAMASLQARENDYVAPEKMNLVIAETGLVPPDESVTITFTTPEEPGEYEYICTFPGHFAAGMRGTLYVK